jgi:hypothetical protein
MIHGPYNVKSRKFLNRLHVLIFLQATV